MNYTVLSVKMIAEALSQRISGYILTEVFSSRNSLYLNFQKEESCFSIKMQWEGRKCFIFFETERFTKPVPHSVKFEPLINARIIAIRHHHNNRSFQIAFENEYILVFKLYDGLSNVLLFHKSLLISHFRTRIENDLKLKLDDFDKSAAYISESDAIEFVDLFNQINLQNREEVSILSFDTLKHDLIQQSNNDIKRLMQLKIKCQKAIKDKADAIPFEEIGNILMANLNKIHINENEVSLLDFYRDREIRIKLKKELNAAQNAEYYYRKSKNEKITLELLNQRIIETDNQLELLRSKLINIHSTENYKELKVFAKTEKAKKKVELFREFELDGFRILVGKSASNNDLLTMNYSSKNDLWLHAKGVSGSHVIIKYIPGKKYTKSIIDYAASIAAYFSKSKGSAFVPVIYVERKYVRKPKGATPGSVLIEKEQVVLVKPISM